MKMSSKSGAAGAAAAGASATPFSGLSLAASPPSRISLASNLKMAASKQQQPHRGFGQVQATANDGKSVKKLTIKNAKCAGNRRLLRSATSWTTTDGFAAAAILAPSTSSASSTAADYANNSLQTLVRAARAILSTPPEPIPESLQALYGLCEGLVSTTSTVAKAGLAQTLYDRVRIEVERKVGGSGNSLRKMDATEGEAWLTELERTWKAFNEKMVS